MDDNATEFDGSIDSAIGLLIQPDEELPDDSGEEAQALNGEVEESDDAESYDDAETDDEQESEDDESDDDGESDEDEDQDTESDDNDSEAGKYTVTVDGKEVSVSLDELKRGYSGQQYVQKGMRENAEARKQVEEVYAALNSERQQIANLYQQIQSGEFVKAPTPPDRSMLDVDPIGYMQAKEQYEQDVQAYHQKQQQLQQVTQANMAAQQRQLEAQLKREMEQLVASIPEFADRETAEKFKNTLTTKGQEIYGYSVEELQSVVDHRAIRVLRDAIKYQELVNGKDKAIAKAKAKPQKTVKAGAKKSQPSRKDKSRSLLRKTGSLDAAVDLILNS